MATYRFIAQCAVSYTHLEDTTSITDNIISDLLVDKKGNLWIGCAKGLIRYNYETNAFARLQFPDGRKPRIYSMVERHTGDIPVSYTHLHPRGNRSSGSDG